MTPATRRRSAAKHPEADLLDLRRRMGRLHLDAAALTPPAKVEGTMRQWLSRGMPDLDADAGTKLAATAMAMALELESLTPSHSEATAVDRLGRQRAFGAEDAADFQKSDLYRERAGGGRQKATTSFQYGLVRGIRAKLDARKAERDARTFRTTGRDLVSVEASVVEDELARLDMALTAKASTRGRTVLLDAYEAGHVASGRFEIQSELE